MNEERLPDINAVYQIRVKGSLDQKWSDWFDGFTIEPFDGDTVLTGPVADQAALHGLFAKIRDLGLPILLVMGASHRKDMVKHIMHHRCNASSKNEILLTKGIRLAATLSYLTVIGTMTKPEASLLLEMDEHPVASLEV